VTTSASEHGYETGIFLAAALVLAGFCFWWVGRRCLST
jgi:hypothetical protein